MEFSKSITIEDDSDDREEVCLEIPIISSRNNTETVDISEIIKTLSTARPKEFFSKHMDDGNDFLNDCMIGSSREFLCESTGRQLINSEPPKKFVEEIVDDEISQPSKKLKNGNLVTELEDDLSDENQMKLIGNSKTASNEKVCEDITFESIVLSETEETTPTNEAGINYSDVKNPNEELMKNVAFLRVCVNYMMVSLGKPTIEFGDNVSLEWMLNIYRLYSNSF